MQAARASRVSCVLVAEHKGAYRRLRRRQRRRQHRRRRKRWRWRRGRRRRRSPGRRWRLRRRRRGRHSRRRWRRRCLLHHRRRRRLWRELDQAHLIDVELGVGRHRVVFPVDALPAARAQLTQADAEQRPPLQRRRRHAERCAALLHCRHRRRCPALRGSCELVSFYPQSPRPHAPAVVSSALAWRCAMSRTGWCPPRRRRRCGPRSQPQ